MTRGSIRGERRRRERVMIEGLIGALVGGGLVLLGSVYGIGAALRNALDRERRRRDEERAEGRRRLTAQLLAEIKDNISVLERPQLDYGFALGVHGVWDAAKGQVPFPAEGLEDAVRRAYTQVHWYNAAVTAATVDRETVRWMAGQQIINDQGRKARLAMEKAGRALEEAFGETRPR